MDTWTWIVIAAIGVAILIGATIYGIRELLAHIDRRTDERVDTMITAALSRPIHKPWQTLDDELIDVLTNNKEND